MKRMHILHDLYDVIVVGAGPAGSTSALSAATEGAHTLLIDKKANPGLPVQCAEFIPRLLTREIALPERVIAQPTTVLEYHLGDQSGCMSAPGFMIHRDLFDRHLIEKAIDSGVALSTATRALALQKDGIVVEVNGKKTTVKGRVIIGADGPLSQVSAWMGNPRGEMYVGLQKTVPAGSSDILRFYFSPLYGCGYAWLFPKDELAHVGVCVAVESAPSLRPLLDDFMDILMQNEEIRSRDTTRLTCGLIPTSGPRERTVLGNILLVGDAAGQTNPLTGAGIASAVMCGKMAGKWAARAALQKNLSLFQNYEREWQSLFGSSLSRALTARQSILTSRDSTQFYNRIKAAWGYK